MKHFFFVRYEREREVNVNSFKLAQHLKIQVLLDSSLNSSKRMKAIIRIRFASIRREEEEEKKMMRKQHKKKGKHI